jgi:hypothetical protein
MRYQLSDKDFYISKNRENSLNIFWLGFTLYTLSYTLTVTLIYFNIVYLQALMFAGLACIIYGAANLIKFKIRNSYLKTVYFMYLAWLVGIMARGFQFDFFSIKESLVNPGYGLFIYLTPLFLLFPVNFAFYRKLFLVIFIQSLFYFVYSLAFVKHVLDPDRTSVLSQGIVENFSLLSFPSGFVLLTYLYHPKMRKIIAFGTMMATLLFAVYRARRGMILMSVTSLLFTLVIYLVVTKRTAMVGFIILVMLLIGYMYYSSLYNQSNFGIFNFLVERADEDTRTGVEDAMKEDMTTMEWWIGKGINGEYYCPNIDSLDSTGYRSVVETGFLQIMLKGGIISLVLLLLILVPALVRGIAKSKNILCKAAGIWILMWILFLYPTVGNCFVLTHMLVWLCAGICYSPQILNMTDAEVFEALQEPKKGSSRKQSNKFLQTEV